MTTMKTSEDLLKKKGITKTTKFHNYGYLYETVSGIIDSLDAENARLIAQIESSNVQMLELRSQLAVEKCMKY
jgi:hypothetical protein